MRRAIPKVNEQASQLDLRLVCIADNSDSIAIDDKTFRLGVPSSWKILGIQRHVFLELLAIRNVFGNLASVQVDQVGTHITKSYNLFLICGQQAISFCVSSTELALTFYFMHDVEIPEIVVASYVIADDYILNPKNN